MDKLLDQGVEFFNSGHYFKAHESWEDLWRKTVDPARRLFYQGLIHVAVGFYHLENHNLRGGHAQLRKALKKIAPTGAFDGIDSGDLVGKVNAALCNEQFDGPVIRRK